MSGISRRATKQLVAGEPSRREDAHVTRKICHSGTAAGSLGLGLANWSERWFPDPLIFALIGIVVVFIVGLLLHQSPAKLAIQGGKNFWTLVPFTMQMVMIIVGGYVVASTPIVYRAIRALAGIPRRRVERLPWWLCSPCSRR